MSNGIWSRYWHKTWTDCFPDIICQTLVKHGLEHGYNNAAVDDDYVSGADVDDGMMTLLIV